MTTHGIRLGMMAVLAAFATGCTQSGQETAQQETKAPEQAPAAHQTAHWSYEGDTGPAHWSSLNADWSECGGGRNQSPIDIEGTIQADLAGLRANFKPASLRIVHNAHVADAINNGHTIQVNYGGGDMLSVGEEQFELVQYHFHSPSEHTVAGKHYAMEMHLVHKSAEGKLAVVGVFVEEGAHNAAFDPIWSNLPTAKGTENHFENVTVDVNQLLPSDLSSYRYDGSLTTPPCSEGVKWIVLATPIALSADQIGAFRAIIQGNNRPVQPRNGRQVATDHTAMN